MGFADFLVVFPLNYFVQSAVQVVMACYHCRTMLRLYTETMFLRDNAPCFCVTVLLEYIRVAKKCDCGFRMIKRIRKLFTMYLFY